MNEQSGKNEKSSSDANKEKNIIRNWLILLAAPIICLTIVASFQNYHYQNMRNFNTRDIPKQKPNSKKYSAHEQFESKFDNYIKNRHKQIFESLTPEKQQEFIELENYIQDKLEPIFMNIKPEQELYFVQNTELIGQAEYLNTYLNDYGYIIKWCSTYHPVDNLRIEYNNYFGSAKEKAKNILVSFIGDESFTKLDDFYSKDKKILEFYNTQQESTYNTIGKSLMKVKNKEEYCKIWNRDAKDIFQKGYERLKSRTPLLFAGINLNTNIDFADNKDIVDEDVFTAQYAKEQKNINVDNLDIKKALYQMDAIFVETEDPRIAYYGFDRRSPNTKMTDAIKEFYKKIGYEQNDDLMFFIDPSDNIYPSKLKEMYKKITPKQKEYLKNNKDLIEEAIMAYNDIQKYYYVIKWCKQSYEINNLYKIMDDYFANKKEKTLGVIKQAGLLDENMKITNMHNVNKFYEEIQKLNKFYEWTYNTTNSFVKKNVKKNVDKIKYCKGLDSRPDLYMIGIKKSYEMDFPNF